MIRYRALMLWLLSAVLSMYCSPLLAAYNLEVPVDPWDEYRLQFKTYSKYLLASYDRAFVDDYEGAIREVGKAIELLPEEGIGFAERGKYYRMLNNPAMAEVDFKKSLLLFEQAIERYRPDKTRKNKKSASRKVDQAEAARLIATLRYQRGEAYFSFEHYRQAADDFAISCQSGNTVACSRIWDVKAIEKRGTHWVPISALQYYDRQRVERPAGNIVRVWVRREDSQPVQSEAGLEKHVQQHLELNCSTREFRLLEGFVSSGGSQTAPQKIAESGGAKPFPGSAPSRLLMILCARSSLK